MHVRDCVVGVFFFQLDTVPTSMITRKFSLKMFTIALISPLVHSIGLSFYCYLTLVGPQSNPLMRPRQTVVPN
jgi:hypothetical protein